MTVTISTGSGKPVSGTKSLGLAGIIASIVTTATSTGTSHTHWLQILTGVGGVVLYSVDHIKTILAAYKKGVG